MSDKTPLEVVYEALLESLEKTATAIGQTAENVANDQNGPDAFERAKAAAVLTDVFAKQIAEIPLLRGISNASLTVIATTPDVKDLVEQALNNENPLEDDEDDDDGRPN